MTLLEIILIGIVPALIIAFTAFFIVRFFVENEQKKRLLELKYESKNITIPIRLQAYERMAMFLERIEPTQLLFRVNNPELTAYQLQTILLTTIRSEFEHNMSQQVYISAEVWESIRNAKERVINVINLAGGKLLDEATSTDLAANILESVAEQSPTAAAMSHLKKEIATLY